MKIYLVGGAVRDKLMGISIKDRDYVVVGSTPEQMINLGYKPIGKDFPVFLHPITNEEYALARTEKKVAKGYHGFKFFASPEVTLEEDLKRRDITINAIAEDEEGNTYDPFNGVEDIKNKVIRHVSNSFIEDPLRVLRVARFVALDNQFLIQKETLALIKRIVASGELKTLSVERVVAEITKGLEGKNPDIMLHCLGECGALNEIFPGLNPIKNTYMDFTSLGIAIRRNPIKLASESKLIMILLVPFFCDHYLDKSYKEKLPQEEQLLKYLKMSNQSQKIFKSIKEERLNLNNFLTLNAKDKLDCLYRLDFFRRPNITLEILNMLLVLVISSQTKIQSFKQELKGFEKHNLYREEKTKSFNDVRKFLNLFTRELNQLNSKIDPKRSGQEIKELIFQERLSLLKIIS